MEKDALKHFVEQHLEEVQKNEELANTPPSFFAAEISYEEFLKTLLKKL